MSGQISDHEIQELFSLMDVNKDQMLAPKELDCMLRALGEIMGTVAVLTLTITLALIMIIIPKKL